jgi:cephalosporin-C deacetylase
MPWFDLPLDQLREYRTDTAEPAGLDQWWQQRLEAARAAAIPPRLILHEAEIYTPVTVYDTEFSGAGGDRIKAWYLRPADAGDDTPVVVTFIGYGGGRGLPAEHMLLPALGYTVFVMDTRGQGGRWTTGATGDRQGDPAAGPENARVMTRGITQPEGYYYTRLFTDAVRAVETALELTGGPRVAVSGASQGGGLALAAAHLSGGVSATMADVPFLAHPRRAVEITDSRPYGELIDYCSVHSDRVEQVFATLAYIDVVNHAKRISIPGLFSVGLIDDITPPSTVFAAYNHYAGPKDIAVYPFNAHEGGRRHQRAKLDFLTDHLGSAA